MKKEERIAHIVLNLIPLAFEEGLFSQRDGEIIKDFVNGDSYDKISQKYKLSSQRIGKIIETSLNRLDYTAGVLKRNASKLEEEKKDLEAKLSMSEQTNVDLIKIKHRLEDELSAVDKTKVITGSNKNHNPQNFYLLIEDLGFSNRTLRCLRSMKIVNVGQLTAQTPQDLRAIRNFGKTCLEDVQLILNRHGLKLKED